MSLPVSTLETDAMVPTAEAAAIAQQLLTGAAWPWSHLALSTQAVYRRVLEAVRQRRPLSSSYAQTWRRLQHGAPPPSVSPPPAIASVPSDWGRDEQQCLLECWTFIWHALDRATRRIWMQGGPTPVSAPVARRPRAWYAWSRRRLRDPAWQAYCRSTWIQQVAAETQRRWPVLAEALTAWTAEGWPLRAIYCVALQRASTDVGEASILTWLEDHHPFPPVTPSGPRVRWARQWRRHRSVQSPPPRGKRRLPKVLVIGDTSHFAHYREVAKHQFHLDIIFADGMDSRPRRHLPRVFGIVLVKKQVSHAFMDRLHIETEKWDNPARVQWISQGGLGQFRTALQAIKDAADGQTTGPSSHFQ